MEYFTIEFLTTQGTRVCTKDTSCLL